MSQKTPWAWSHAQSRSEAPAEKLQPGTGGQAFAAASPVHAPLRTLPRYPALYLVNTRVWLNAMGRALGRPPTLHDIPDGELDRLATLGFDWVWLLSVWQTGAAGREVSLKNSEWRREFQETLPDLRDEDVAGSGFAITDYTVSAALGGEEALARLRARLRQRGLRLMLDFVPNHTALDHHWVEEHPEFYVQGTELDLARAPQNYAWVKCKQGDRLLAYGRDPYFPGWPDTAQLNYGNPGTQEAMIGVLQKIVDQCDGVRCDMAMLVLPDVYERTWGIAAQPFWPEATRRVREKSPEFCFMAEVYWDLEWTLQQQGFNYAYDKRLYDRLRHEDTRAVCEHLHAGLDYQDKLARFLENHDEPRAAAVFPPARHRAAAAITFCSPGLRFFHQGQLKGFKKRISPHLGRGPNEPTDVEIEKFYGRLLGVLKQPSLREGQWQLLDCAPAWEGNETWGRFVAFAWRGPNEQRLLVAVNYAANQTQCYVRLPFAELAGRRWRLADQMSDAAYDREGNDLLARGLYLDVPPWNVHVFSLSASAS